MNSPQSYSGRFVLRIPPDLHRQLRKLAAAHSQSLNQVCMDLIRGVLEKKDLGIHQIGSDLVPTELIRQITQTWKMECVGIILFGSVARHEEWNTSDMDLLIVLTTETPILRSLYQEWDDSIDPNGNFQHISPQFVSLPEDFRSVGGLWYEMAIDGIVLWDPDLKVSRFLSQLRHELMSGKIRREFAYGQPYWIKHEEQIT